MLDLSDSERLLANAARTIDRRDAEILLAPCWRRSRSQLLARSGEAVPAEVATVSRMRAGGARDGVPVAYLLGRREFWSLEFTVDAAVLVPRPETELLVQRVLDLVPRAGRHVADLGTGSGAIAIALAHERRAGACSAPTRPPGARGGAGNGERLAGGRVDGCTGRLVRGTRRSPIRRAGQQSAVCGRR